MSENRKDYLKKYYHEKYINDEEFRNKMKQNAKIWYNEHKVEILAKRKTKHILNYPPPEELENN